MFTIKLIKKNKEEISASYIYYKRFKKNTDGIKTIYKYNTFTQILYWLNINSRIVSGLYTDITWLKNNCEIIDNNCEEISKMLKYYV